MKIIEYSAITAVVVYIITTLVNYLIRNNEKLKNEAKKGVDDSLKTHHERLTSLEKRTTEIEFRQKISEKDINNCFKKINN